MCYTQVSGLGDTDYLKYWFKVIGKTRKETFGGGDKEREQSFK